MPKISCRKRLTTQRRKHLASNDGQRNVELEEVIPDPVNEQKKILQVHYDKTVLLPDPELQHLSENHTSGNFLSEAVVSAGLRKLNCILPPDWICTADTKGYYILRINSGIVKAIQRQIFVSFSGQAMAYVHCKSSSVLNEAFSSVYNPIKFSQESLDKFCRSILKLVEIAMKYSVCVGANNQETKDSWSTIAQSEIDFNPYLEPYTSEEGSETLRSISCLKLVIADSDDVRCTYCTDLKKCLDKKLPISVN